MEQLELDDHAHHHHNHHHHVFTLFRHEPSILNCDYVLAYERRSKPSDDKGPGLCSKLLAMLTKRPQGVNVDENKPTEEDEKEAKKLKVDSSELTPAARRNRYIQRLKDYAHIRQEEVPDPDDGRAVIVFLLITLYDDVLSEATSNMALLLPKFPPVERYSLIEGHWVSRLFYLEICSRKSTPGNESCAPFVNPVYTTEFGSVAADKDIERIEYLTRRQRIEVAHTVLQLLSYAHENHKRPFTQVGMDRLQKIGALTDHFAPHDCSLLFQPKELREVIASAGEQGTGNEMPTKATREHTADLQPTRESFAHLQKANGDAAPQRRHNFNAVDPTHTNSTFDAHEGDASAIASASATSPTAFASGDQADEDEDDDWKDHKRCHYLRHYLNVHWASFTNVFRRQPIDHIREYFGESIAWYFAWAGFYASWLIMPCIASIICFIFGIIWLFVDTSADNVCSSQYDRQMCPPCQICLGYNLSSACFEARASNLFDNPASIIYAALILFWATGFLEFWKRQTGLLQNQWDVNDMQDILEVPRAEFLQRQEKEHTRLKKKAALKREKTELKLKQMNKEGNSEHDSGSNSAQLTSANGVQLSDVTDSEDEDNEDMLDGDQPVLSKDKKKLLKRQGSTSGFTITVSFTTLLLMVLLVISAVAAVVVYRMAVIAALTLRLTFSYASTVATITGSAISYVAILILGKLYRRLSVWLNNIENHRTQSSYNNALATKIFFFEFVNFYAPTFYIAFIKGKLTGYVNNWWKVFGVFYTEPCGNGDTCVFDLTKQIGTFVVTKVILDNVLEHFVPWVVRRVEVCCVKKATKSDVEAARGHVNVKHEEKHALLLEDYLADEYTWDAFFSEYLEQVMQFGYLVMFAAACPLVALVMFVSNVVELRLDAIKLLRYFERPVPERTSNIGIWNSIINMLFLCAIITNSVYIAFTSDIIPKLLWVSQIPTWDKYINAGAATFLEFSLHNATDLDNGVFCWCANVQSNELESLVVKRWYKGYTDGNGDLSKFYWNMLSIKLAFVLGFVVIIYVIVETIRFLVPDIPDDVWRKLKDERDSFITHKDEFKTANAIMRDDLQQLPPMLITLLSGGKLRRDGPVRHITMPEEFVRQIKAPQQQQPRPASSADGRTHSNRVGPLGNEHVDRPDNALRQRRPTKDAQVNTEPRRRLLKNSTQEEADTERQPQTAPQTAIGGGVQEPILLKKRVQSAGGPSVARTEE